MTKIVLVDGRRVAVRKNRIGPRYTRFRLDAHTGQVRMLWGVEWLPATDGDAESCGTTLAALRAELTEEGEA